MVLDKTKNTVLGGGLLHILCKNCSGFFWLWGKVVTALEWWWIGGGLTLLSVHVDVSV